MSVFDHVYYPFHHDHINTPLITPFELQMVGGCRMKTGGVITPLGGLDKSLRSRVSIRGGPCKKFAPYGEESYRGSATFHPEGVTPPIQRERSSSTLQFGG